MFPLASFMSAARKGASAAIQPETYTFVKRVLADGGVVEDAAFLNAFITNAKVYDYFSDIIYAGSPSWGVKIAAGAAAKLYSVSGAPYDLTQASASNQPDIIGSDLAGKSRLLFDGISHRLISAGFVLNQPETVIIGGFEQKTWTANDRFFDGVSSALGTCYQSATTPNIRLFAGANSTENSDLAVATPAHLRCLFNSTASEVQVDNNAIVNGDSGIANMGGFTLGGAPTSFFSHMSAGFAVVLNSAVDANYTAKVDAIYNFSRAAYDTP